MRRSNWTPLIVPNDFDETVYLLADDFGRIGRAWREAGAVRKVVGIRVGAFSG
jgi:hypothetical protein